MVVSFLTGVTFFALGTFRWGNLVRFVPYPVVGGFLAGTGWLLASGGVGVAAEIQIRALGVDRMLEIVDRGTFSLMQLQPEQRGRPVGRQLHRWLCSSSRRYHRYLPVLTDALDRPIAGAARRSARVEADTRLMLGLLWAG